MKCIDLQGNIFKSEKQMTEHHGVSYSSYIYRKRLLRVSELL